MKRRHELSVDGGRGAGALPGEQSLENAPRQIFKKRRVVESDNWGGLNRRKSLRDINNLSHPSSIQHDTSATPNITQNKTNRTLVTGSAAESLPPSRPPTSEPAGERTLPSRDSRPEPTSTHLRPSLVITPGQQQLSEPAPSPRPINPSSATPNYLSPRFVSSDKPVRITQSRTQQSYVSSQNRDPDSDQEDEDEGTDEESEDEIPEPKAEDPAENDERQRVESRYAEVNKLLGNLFLSRHRNRQ